MPWGVLNIVRAHTSTPVCVAGYEYTVALVVGELDVHAPTNIRSAKSAMAPARKTPNVCDLSIFLLCHNYL